MSVINFFLLLSYNIFIKLICVGTSYFKCKRKLKIFLPDYSKVKSTLKDRIELKSYSPQRFLNIDKEHVESSATTTGPVFSSTLSWLINADSLDVPIQAQFQ